MSLSSHWESVDLRIDDGKELNRNLGVGRNHPNHPCHGSGMGLPFLLSPGALGAITTKVKEGTT